MLHLRAEESARNSLAGSNAIKYRVVVHMPEADSYCMNSQCSRDYPNL